MSSDTVRHIDPEMIAAMQAVDLYSRCSPNSNGGEIWTASEEMDAEVWGSRKRLGRKEAAVRVETMYLRWCQEKGNIARATKDTIFNAMRLLAEKKRQAVLMAKETEEKWQGSVDPEEFFAEWIETGFELVKERNGGKPIGPVQILGASTGKKLGSDATWKDPSNLKARLRTDWRRYAKQNKKQFDQDVTTETLLREKHPEVMQSILGMAAENLRDLTRFQCEGDNYHQYFDLLDGLLATLYKDYSSLSNARKQLYKAAFYHWQWQVKRSLWGRRTKSEIFISIYGPTRGGKDEFIKALLGDHLSPWRYNWASLTAITKIEQNGAFLSDYLVGYVREMAVEPSLNQFAALKGILTDESVDQRAYYTQESRNLHRRMSCISASNIPLVEISPDYTGMARFVEVTMDADRAYREANRGTTEVVRDEFRSRHSLRLFRMVNEEEDATVFDLFPDLSALLAAHQEEIRPASPVESLLKDSNYHPSPVGIPNNCRVSDDRLISDGGGEIPGIRVVPLGDLLKKWAYKYRQKDPAIKQEPPSYSVLHRQMEIRGFEMVEQDGVLSVVLGMYDAYSNRASSLDEDIGDALQCKVAELASMVEGLSVQDGTGSEEEMVDW